MLINFNFTNFKSFKETAEFDMQAYKGKDLYETNVTEITPQGNKKPLPLLLSSVIYGANASGKTKFIEALHTMEKVITGKYRELSETITPFKLNSESLKQPCRFEVTILAEDNVVYEYGFSATTEAIHKEWLYAYPKGRVKILFQRTLKQNKKNKYHYDYINRLTGHKKTWEEATTPQRLFLSTAIQLNNQELLPVYNWFAHKLICVGTTIVLNKYTAQYCQNGNTEKVINLLKGADIAIEDIVIEKGDISSEILRAIKKINIDEYEFSDQSIEVFTFHESQDGEIVKFKLEEESQGTQRIFDLAYAILHSLETGKVFFIDELDNSLHPALVKFIVKLFQSTRNNQHNAQLIFTTHDASLFNEDLFRNEQIWFCEKNHKTQESELYSLMDFKLRKDIKNFERAYLHGRFGATPVVAEPSLESFVKN